jgi:hypothetical protein
MKKNILIAALVVVTLLSLVYAMVQRAAAVKAQRVAEQNAEEAQRQRVLADANAIEATLQAEKARVEAENARRAEADCDKKK